MLLLVHCVIDDCMATWGFVFIISNLCKVFAGIVICTFS